MEARADLEQGSDPAAHADDPGRRANDARDRLQERRLAGSVTAHDPDDIALVDLEVDIAERPDLALSVRLRLAAARAQVEPLAQRDIAPLAEAVALAEPLRLDHDCHLRSGPRTGARHVGSRRARRRA